MGPAVPGRRVEQRPAAGVLGRREHQAAGAVFLARVLKCNRGCGRRGATARRRSEGAETERRSEGSGSSEVAKKFGAELRV